MWFQMCKNSNSNGSEEKGINGRTIQDLRVKA